MDTRTRSHEIDELLTGTCSADAATRRDALKQLCPCHIRSDQPQVWDRVLGLVGDPDVKVRRWVLHILCDGSPNHRQAQVLTALERLRDDPAEKLRRHARKVLAQFRSSGRVNVL